MILVVDFGGQYTHLISRAIREQRIVAHECSRDEIGETPPQNLHGVVLSGGPNSVDDADVALVERILSWKKPVLGLCYGHQLLARIAQATVSPGTSHEYGKADFRVTKKCQLTQNFAPRSYEVWMSHGDSVTGVPANTNWQIVGVTDRGQCAAIANESQLAYGLQFHPEVHHTTCGHLIFEAFLRDVCRAPSELRNGELSDQVVNSIREHVGPVGHILIAWSSGVDSTTVAVACQKALGSERVHPVFVDTGLMRQEDLVIAQEAKGFLPGLVIENATDRFLEVLRGVTDSEQKRSVIGGMFWHVFHAVATRLKNHYPITAFSQGTIAPDTIESGSRSRAARTIKTHHNLVQPHDDFPFARFEPLRELYKDQVRSLAELVGVPISILRRHPFPGPGLAIRIDGEVTPDRVRIVRASDALFIEGLRKAGYYDVVSQALAVLLATNGAVCVRGDAPGTGYPIILRAFETLDFMTGKVVILPADFLCRICDQIANEVPGVANVAYNYTGKPPATIEWRI